MPLTQVRCCSILPVLGSNRSSAPWLPTVQMPPLLEGLVPSTKALRSEPVSSSNRDSTENCHQRGSRCHRPALVLANQMPPSRSS